MFDITSLWLVILAGTVAAYIGSMIVWMLLPHHRSDYRSLPNEAATMSTLGEQNLKPGLYNFPHCLTWADMKKPEFINAMNKGPVGFLTIVPNGLPPMGAYMLKQLLYFLFGTIMIAYVVSLTIKPDAAYMDVFRVTAMVAFLAYGYAVVPDGIWFGRKWSTIFKYLFDALLYAALTAGVFAWLWPLAH